MTFRPWRRNDQVAYDTFAIRFLDCILGVLANGENWRFGWLQFLVSDLKKNVAGAQTCRVRWSAFMNVLKHPALFSIEFVPHEGRGDGVAAGDLRTLRVPKTGVAGLQFGQQILYLLLEFFITGASEDLASPGFRQLFPICPVHAGIEMLPRHKLTDAGINLLFRLSVETHRPPEESRFLPLRPKQKLPNNRAEHDRRPSRAGLASRAAALRLSVGLPRYEYKSVPLVHRCMYRQRSKGLRQLPSL